mgnify:FL=1
MITPIKWTPYTGEDVCIKTTIKQGKKVQEWRFYEDKVKAVPRGNAYCIGNGPSRKDFDLTKLKPTGQTYGCNALYRDFMPDFIFSVDSKMTKQMMDDDVGLKTFHYAPALEVNRYKRDDLHMIPNNPQWLYKRPAELHLIPSNPRWISGNVAFWVASVHGHKNIYLIGYDFREYGPGQLNNIYQDTECYGERNQATIFEGWLKQFRDMIKMRPDVNFTVVHDNPPDYLNYLQTGSDLGNTKLISYDEFEKVLTP